MNRGFLSRRVDFGSLDQKDIRSIQDETTISYVVVSLAIVFMVAFSIEGGWKLINFSSEGHWAMVTELLIGKSLLGFFLLSVLCYHLTRLGYLKRFVLHRSASDKKLEQVYEGSAPSVVFLVPSYKEEPQVVRQTLIAAALQQSPNRRIVLLIDDPPKPDNLEDTARLVATRNLPLEIKALFSEPSHKFEAELAGFIQRRKDNLIEPLQEITHLSALLRETAAWLDSLADSTPINNHTDALFVEEILRVPARLHLSRALALMRKDPSSMDLLLEYLRLAELFKIEVTGFERKRYVNLSHEANKAMNLNSYLALMGKSFREILSPAGLILEETNDSQAALQIPNADFVVVLDADSLILSEYSLRLIHFMIQPENARVAVVQTPYAAVPGATNMIERIAGATTDVQLMCHQGSILFDAGSWVGASALVRRAALNDIVHTVEERGFPILSYIRDRTLNEDTDTTVDLIRKNWTVHNYPDRLAYSATPCDFGSLLIQRRRWATGGLIILPNLFRYFFARPSLRRFGEVLIRAQYILGAPVGSVCALMLIIYPFSLETVWSFWAFFAFITHLFVYRRDLMHSGNRGGDLLRAISLNAMLIPINLAGAINSLLQLWSGRKIPFQRTPKVKERTAATPIHISAQFGLFLFVCSQVLLWLGTSDWLRSLFFLFYAGFYGYTLHVFIGWHETVEDLFTGIEFRPRLLLKLFSHKLIIHK